MTEFDFVDNTPDSIFASAWLHGLYVAEMLLEFLSEPVVTQVEIYNLHSDSKRSSLIYDGREKFGPRGIITTEPGALSPSGQVVSLFGQALKGASAAAAVSFPNLDLVRPDQNGPQFTPFPAVTGVALSYQAKKDGLVLVNLSSHPISLNYGDGSNKQMQSIFAPTLSTNIVTNSSLSSITRQISLRQFEIPAYSVNLVQ
jgi:hypothetical protein